MHRTPLRPSLPQSEAMFGFSHSLDNHQVPSVLYLEQERSRSLGYQNESVGDFNTRPNRIISGFRRLNRAHFTGTESNIELHADRIVEKLEEDQALMDDTPVSEQLRKEALRDLPQCLTMKRCVKSKLSKSVSQKSKRKPIGFWKRFKYKLQINYSKFVSSLKNFNYFELWQGSLKEIEGRFGTGYASFFKFLRWLFVMNLVIAVFPFIFVIVPQIIHDSSNSGVSHNERFSARNIFVGDGYLNNSILYYGHYTNTVIKAISNISFDMPATYFSVIVILYLIALVALAVSVAISYRRTFIETEGGLQNVYASRVFCGWDYGIATKEAAELKSASIYNDLKELLSEEIKDIQERSCLFMFWTYTIQIVVNIFVLVILGGVGWITWLLLKKFSTGDENEVYVTALVLNLIIMIFPSIFNYIAKYEDYNNPRTAMYITLGRTYLLGAVIVGVLLVFWFLNARSSNCWENSLASEIYRLIIFDFLFSVILSPLIDVCYFIGLYFARKNPKTEFNVAKHILQVIYNQGLFWVGFFYSPLLPTIVAIKMFITWYVREICVRKLCRPPKRTWRAAQAYTWFMMMTLVSILLVIAIHGYTLTSVPTSSTCGPFRDYEYTYQIVTSQTRAVNEYNFWGVVMNVTKPGGVAFLMIILGIWVYYVKEQAYANREKVKLLRETLLWMATDKKYLVEMYNNLTKGQINPYLRDNRFIDPSKVLPHEYIQETPRASFFNGVNARFDEYSNKRPNPFDEDEVSARYRQYSNTQPTYVNPDEVNARYRQTSNTKPSSFDDDEVNARLNRYSITTPSTFNEDEVIDNEYATIQPNSVDEDEVSARYNPYPITKPNSFDDDVNARFNQYS